MSKEKVKQLPNELLFAEVEWILKTGKSVKIPVKGYSMHPFIKEGDSVLIYPLEFGKLKRGDIALARTAYGVVLHRVLEATPQQAILKGDGNLFQTEKVDAQQFIGVAHTLYTNQGKTLLLQSSREVFWWRLWMLLSPCRKYLLYLYRKIILKNSACRSL